jgi:hypothetical protein
VKKITTELARRVKLTYEKFLLELTEAEQQFDLEKTWKPSYRLNESERKLTELEQPENEDPDSSWLRSPAAPWCRRSVRREPTPASLHLRLRMGLQVAERHVDEGPVAQLSTVL